MSTDRLPGAGPARTVVDRYNRRFGDRLGRMNGPQFALVALSLVALVAAPAWVGLLNFTLRSMAVACIWAIFAMSWDVQSGYTGYVSFGHSVLSGAAGYTIGVIVYNVSPDVPVFVLIPLALVATLAVGLLIAVPALRLRGPYFSLMTLVAVLIFYRGVIAFNQYTGGELGIGARVIDPFTYDPVARYYAMLVPMLAVAAALVYVSRSDVGTVFVAIRENEAAVEAAGLDATKFKIWSFVLSSIPMGVGGVLLVYIDGFVGPDTFLVIDRSIEMIAMAVVGGMGSILGPIGGAFLLVLLRDEVLNSWVQLDPTVRFVALWVVVLLVLVFARHGLFRTLWHLLGRLGGERG